MYIQQGFILLVGLAIVADSIYSGQDAKLGEFPWMALLEYENEQGEKSLACAGALINNRYVLTAANCLTRGVQAKGQLVNVRLGEHNLETTEDCELVDGTQVCADPVQNIPVERVIPHPDYFGNPRKPYNDIGLVRLGETVSFSDFIRPIGLPSAEHRTETGGNVTIAGWGRTLTARQSDIKQKLSIPIFDQVECVNKYRSKSVEIQDTQICAGGEFQRDSCSGDAGGPLMSFSNVNSAWLAEGVVSFGIQCGLEGWPAVYTKVPVYIDWIRSVLDE